MPRLAHAVLAARRSEVDLLLGDPSKAKTKLDWEPKISFEALAEIMMNADLALIERR